MGAGVYAPGQTVEVEPRLAAKVAAWIIQCGALAIWESHDLGQIGKRWFTPARLTDGSIPQRPHWSCADKPERVITVAAEVEVVERHELRRIRVSAKPGYGLGWQLTDASTRRLNVALAEAGEDASAIQHACKSAVRVIGHANCLPDDAPAWMEQDAGLN